MKTLKDILKPPFLSEEPVGPAKISIGNAYASIVVFTGSLTVDSELCHEVRTWLKQAIEEKWQRDFGETDREPKEHHCPWKRHMERNEKAEEV